VEENIWEKVGGYQVDAMRVSFIPTLQLRGICAMRVSFIPTLLLKGEKVIRYY